MLNTRGISKTLTWVIAAILIIVAFTAGIFVDRMFLASTEEVESVLIVGMTEDISSAITPLWIQGGIGFVSNSIFEGLVIYKASTTLPLEIEPMLATSWSTSEDGLEWTFQLREGVKFHDGTDFNSTAVKTHFDKAMELKKGISYLFAEGLLNKTEIIDTYEVKFVLNYPNTAWLDILTVGPCLFESPTSIAKYGDAGINDHPIGTGPFKFVSTIVGSEVILEANHEWWKVEQGLEETIEIDKIIFRQFSDPATMKLALESGAIHVAHGALAQTDYPSLLSNPDIDSWERPITAHLRWIQFNHNASICDYFPKKELRQAFAYAIDYDEIVDVIFDNGDFAKRASSFLPEEYVESKPAFGETYYYNATKSLELIEAAGFTPPITVTLTITPTHYTPFEQDIASLIVARAEPAGFDVQIEVMDYNAMKAQFKAGEGEMHIWGWRAIAFDTDYWSPFMHSSKYSSPNGNFLAGDMASLCPYIDDLLAEASGTPNQTRKTEIWHELQDLYVEWVPGIPLFRPVAYDFTQKTVEGVLLTPIGPDIRFYATRLLG